MSAILEAVRAEIAKVEQEHGEALEEALVPLREIEELALRLNGSEVVEPAEEPTWPQLPPAKGEPQSDADSEEKSAAPRQRRARRSVSDAEIAAAARKCVTGGHATPNSIVTTLGTKAPAVRVRVESLLARWGADGYVVADEPVRGRPSFKLASPEEAEPSPEPPAPAPTPADAGATSDSSTSDEEAKEEAEDFGLVGDGEVDVDEYRPPRGGGGETMAADLQPLADRIKAHVTLDPHTTREIAAALEIEDVKLVRRVTEKLVRMGQLQQRGYNGANPRYSVTPSLESRGVTVRQADRAEPLETQILEFIDEAGSLSIRDLAVKTVAHPRDVAAAVTALIERRVLKKRRAHPDAVYERPGEPTV